MIKNKTMTVHDRNNEGKTILILAAWRGCYETVQFLLNYGADINATDEEGKDALSWARTRGYFNVEQLLLFSQFNTTIGMYVCMYIDYVIFTVFLTIYNA